MDLTVVNTFKAFMADEKAWNMYVTGPAGSGKTTDLHHSVKYCMDNEIPYMVCAFTHKACGILRTKLPDGALVATLHSFLKKCPSINQDALNHKHVNVSLKVGEVTIKPKVIFIDEYSMIGEKDWADLGELQDSDYDGIPELKIVWLGDSNQLPPVGDQITIYPEGKYQVKLTKIYRNDNPLQIPLNALISYINEDADIKPLKNVPGYFERDLDLVKSYCECKDDDKVILAYTNQNVQWLNQEIHSVLTGRAEVSEGDKVFSPSTQRTYTFISWIEEIGCINLPWSGDELALGSKYKTLENLVNHNLCKFALLETEEGEFVQHAVIFGHYDFKCKRETLEKSAVEINNEIESKYRGYKASGWSRANPHEPLARKRAKLWRDCLSFKDCVMCIDFAYAMTVHKSQGSTYGSVFLDMQDLHQVASRDLSLYLKLVYTGISRARYYVGTN